MVDEQREVHVHAGRSSDRGGGRVLPASAGHLRIAEAEIDSSLPGFRRNRRLDLRSDAGRKGDVQGCGNSRLRVVCRQRAERRAGLGSHDRGG